eukprot:CAMPEP_0204896990 /NCGR_PEP_ID=MMETSP1397-20131031/487_1 /ASSEMBLY_ACC=CAM_ASM_000891 /TAXON_ID=49980 /ORGANISM="Climacostomum Climacostomum virens, Strain Stock W-24" /LENGTH=349 /DNA_ID=CAMNT_0052064687 /DNA_START=231 /DNA_END=1280 /DNA_ORIENTATION=+
MFYGSIGYGSLEETIRTLFSAALGSFEYDVFIAREELGTVALTIWIVVAMILILNILTAVLITRYEGLTHQVNSDFVSMLFVYIQSTTFTPEYGAMVLFPLPFTFMLIPFVPLYFLKVDKVKLTAFLAKVSYLPMLCLAIVCFSLYNLMWGFYAHFRVVWMLTRDVSINRSDRAANLAKWIIMGPWYVTYLGLISFAGFYRYLYKVVSFELVELYSEKDRDFTLTLLKAFMESNPGLEEIPLKEALELPSISLGIHSNPDEANESFGEYKEEAEWSSDRASVEAENLKYKGLLASKHIITKLASFASQTLNIEEAVTTLQTLTFDQFKVYSRYITEKAIASIDLSSSSK